MAEIDGVYPSVPVRPPRGDEAPQPRRRHGKRRGSPAGGQRGPGAGRAAQDGHPDLWDDQGDVRPDAPPLVDEYA